MQALTLKQNYSDKLWQPYIKRTRHIQGFLAYISHTDKLITVHENIEGTLKLRYSDWSLYFVNDFWLFCWLLYNILAHVVKTVSI